MSGAFTPEHEELRRYVRQWLDERAPIDHIRQVMETAEGYDPAQWTELGELGWLGMAIPEEHGGGGQGFMELAVLAEEMGRSLYPSPFLSTVVMAAGLLSTIDGGDDWLKDVAAGRLRVAVATSPSGDKPLRAVRTRDGWSVSGRQRFVLDGHTAHQLIVAAETEDGLGLFVVASDEPGVNAGRLDVLDLTRPQADLELGDAPASLLGEPGEEGQSAFRRMEQRAIAAVAMEQVGGAQACLDMSVEYAKERHQFGRPIGSFQAIKHMCADMLVLVESARSAAYHLAWAIEHDEAEVPVAASLAKSYCSEAFYRVAADTIQVHGGTGFTWEHPAHLYLKRAKSSQLLFGSGADARARLAEELELA